MPGLHQARRLATGVWLAIAWAALGAAQTAQAAGDAQAQLALGRQVFLQSAVPACALCHALRDAGAEGAVGPVLDELRPDAARVGRAVRLGIGQMPAFAGKLSDAQIEAVALYVAQATGAPR